MRLFATRQIYEAFEFAEAGGQALHVWTPSEMWRGRSPRPFRRAKEWAHLIDNDAERLERTAKALGVRVIVIGRHGRRGQHIDLCGKPLERAKAMCVPEERR